ncbi:hypothetical protein FWH09_01660 [Candidatus Saccharibacteria bacterium]|nr:hypothetical protein [Candidatus Saccharibacteria bacterium]
MSRKIRKSLPVAIPAFALVVLVIFVMIMANIDDRSVAISSVDQVHAASSTPSDATFTTLAPTERPSPEPIKWPTLGEGLFPNGILLRTDLRSEGGTWTYSERISNEHVENIARFIAVSRHPMSKPDSLGFNYGDDVIATALVALFGTKASFLPDPPLGALEDTGPLQFNGAVKDVHISLHGDDFSFEAIIDTVAKLYFDDEFCRQNNLATGATARRKVEEAWVNTHQASEELLVEMFGEAGQEMLSQGMTSLPVDPEVSREYNRLRQELTIELVGEVAWILEVHLLKGTNPELARSWATQIFRQADWRHFDP